MLTNGDIEKTYRHRHALERLANEVVVLSHLERQGCAFVPRLRGVDYASRRVVMTNCGHAVQYLPQEKISELFQELESYGVRHDDPELRNITYSPQLGCFCIVDFEFATLLDEWEELAASNDSSLLVSPCDLSKLDQSLQAIEDLVRQACI